MGASFNVNRLLGLKEDEGAAPDYTAAGTPMALARNEEARPSMYLSSNQPPPKAPEMATDFSELAPPAAKPAPRPMAKAPVAMPPSLAPQGEAPKQEVEAADEPDEMDKYNVSPEEQAAARKQKALMMLMGGIGQGLSNQTSVGAIMLGKTLPHQDVMSTAKAFADQADQPIKDKQALMKQAWENQQRKTKQATDDYALEQAERESKIQKDMDTKGSPLNMATLSALLRVNRNAGLGLDENSLKGMSAAEHAEIMSHPAVKAAIDQDAQAKRLAETLAAAQMKASTAAASGGARVSQADTRIHERLAKQIDSDPTLLNLLTTSNNLINAKSNFEKGGATPQEFAELQQAVRSNAGIKSAGGVGEREETYLKSLGINKDKFLQFAFGNPQSVIKSDPAFAKQILGLVDLELANKRKAAHQQVEKLSKGHDTFYNAPGHEGLREDFTNKLKAAKDQFGADEPASGSNADVGPRGASVTQNGYTYTWNPKTKAYE